MLAALLAGCTSANFDPFESCELELVPAVASARAGDEVVLGGGPLTAAYDTRVEVGGVPAEVVSVERSAECSTCETCRLEADCLICGTCLGAELDEARRVECFGDPFEGTEGVCGECEESLAFVVPPLPAGPTTVVVINGAGTSGALPFEILGDAGATADTAPSTADTGGATVTVPTGTMPGPTGDTAATASTGSTADTGLAATDTGLTATTADTAATGDTSATADTAATATTGDTSATGDTGI
jgi:hypothetical protein